MPLADQNASVGQSSDAQLNQPLLSEWKHALAGDPEAQTQWQTDQGGQWTWQSDGVSVRSSGTEWVSFSWRGCGASRLKDLKNFLIEVTISGKAQAAGLSFGHYKDFLTDPNSMGSGRRLQLEVDVEAGRWAFRVDGQLQHRCWWDSAVHSTDDLINGMLTFKASQVEHVLFQNLAVYTFQASCQLSVIITCYRFVQRLRVALRNWCQQSLPTGTYEVVVVNPNSPDGTHEHLAAVAHSYPHVRVRELAVESNLAMNKGAMINRAVQASRGRWIWLADADCLFSPNSASAMMSQINGRDQCLFYGQRRYLTATQTNALLSGRIDGLRDFDMLAKATAYERAPDSAPWGYTQIVLRSILEQIRYQEMHNHFAHSDNLFAEDCKRHGILPEQVDGLFCLHMDHPFTWYGTDAFL